MALHNSGMGPSGLRSFCFNFIKTTSNLKAAKNFLIPRPTSHPGGLIFYFLFLIPWVGQTGTVRPGGASDQGDNRYLRQYPHPSRVTDKTVTGIDI